MRRRSRVIGLAILVLVGASAEAAVSVNPPAVTIRQGETSMTVIATVSWASTPPTGGRTIEVTGLPPFVVTAPSPIDYMSPVGISIDVPFQLQAGLAAPVGTYPLMVTDMGPIASAGSTSLMLTILPAAGFSSTIAPQPIRLTIGDPPVAVTVSTTPEVGFSSPTIDYSFTGLPAWLSTGGNRVATAPGYPPVSFAFSAGAGAMPGTYSGQLVGNAAPGIVRTLPVTVVVSAPPPVVNSVVPATIQRGAENVQFTLSGTGFQAGARLGVSPPDLTVAGATVVSPTEVRFIGSASYSTALGPHLLTLTNPDGQSAQPASVAVTPAPPPVITSVTPPTVRAGASATALTLTGSGFQPGATVSGSTADLIVSNVVVLGRTQIRVSASAPTGASAGPRGLVVSNPDGQSSSPATLGLLAAAPAVSRVEPPAVVQGSRSIVLSIVGERFVPGATVLVASPGLLVERVAFVRPTLLQATVSIRSDAATGPAAMTVINPDAGASQPPAVVLVYPSTALGAPAAVTAAAIAAPLEGSLIAADEQVYAHGVLATSGTGTIVGSWRLDGVPFDRFVALAAGGAPVDVRSRVPIPLTIPGSARLELAIEAPASSTGAAVVLTRVERKASRPRLIAPPDLAVIGAPAPVFRWSLVPGAFGYEVEVSGDALPGTLRFRTAEPAWRPSEKDLERFGHGEMRWLVRPVLAGGVLGDAMEPRRIAVLPSRADLVLTPVQRDPVTSRSLLHWTGGTAGFVYRVELAPAPGAKPVFAALTRNDRYLVPALPAASGPLSAKVTALGPGGREHGGTAPTPLVFAAPAPRMVLASAPVMPDGVLPADRALVTTSRPAISARWNGAVDPAGVLLMLDDMDVTSLAQLGPDSILYTSALPLPPGPHRVSLSLEGSTTGWTFAVSEHAVEDGQSEPGMQPQGDGMASAAPPAHWALQAEASSNHSDAEFGGQDAIRATPSAQWDVDRPSHLARANGDVALVHNLEGERHTVQESRNWLLEGGLRSGGIEGRVLAGYAAPRFVEGAQLLTTGTARGGGEARIATKIGTASYYRTSAALQHGVMGGFGPRQEVEAWAFELPALTAGMVLRAIRVDARAEATAYSAESGGTLTGLMGQIPIAPMLRVVFEGARGEMDPEPLSGTAGRQGNAYLLGLAGDSGTFGYSLNLRHTQARFANPVNPGFTMGSTADRSGADLQLRKSYGATSLSVQVRHLRGGETSGATGPSARETGGVVSVSTRLGQVVMLSLGGDYSTVTGDADLESYLPETDVVTRGANATLSETIGSLSLSQSFAYQERLDSVTPSLDQTTSSGSFSLGGLVLPTIQVSATASAVRQESGTGTRSDMLQLSLQPVWTLARLGLSVQPRAALGRSENSLSDQQIDTEQYQLVLSWAPPRIGQAVSVQLSGDWSRSRIGELAPPAFTRSLLATFVLHWGADSATLAPAVPAPLAAPPGAFDPTSSTAHHTPPGLQWR